MRKKIIPIILAAALLLAGLGIYVSANRSRTQMQLMGQAYAEASGRTDDPVIAAFKGTEIRQSRIDYEKQIMTVKAGYVLISRRACSRPLKKECYKNERTY